MRYEKPLFSCAFLFITIFSFSQAKNYVYYFDKDLNSVEQAKSIFYGIGMYENDLFELRIYNSLNKELVIIEHFKDSSLQMNDGLFASFYGNKAKEWEGNYSMGKQDGLWRNWNIQNHLIDSSIYDNGEKIMQANFIYTDGSLFLLHIDSLKTGSVTEAEFDISGKIVSRKNFKANEDPDIVFTRVEIEAAFPGGPASWARYVTKAIEEHIDRFRESNYGTCVVRFIVDKTGKISNVEATTMKGTELAKVAVNAIKKGPNWVPALVNGHFVRAYRLQPVTLTKPD